MPLKKPREEWSDSYQNLMSRLDNAELNPRAKMALRMYAHGAVKSLKEASEVTGISYSALSVAKLSLPGKRLLSEVDQLVNDRSIQTNVLVERLGRKAIEKIGHLMENAGSENIQLKAAIDLADRSPETSKVHKVQMESFTLSGKDVAALASAIAEGALVQDQFKALTEGNHDYVEGQDGSTQQPSDAQHSERPDEV